MVNELIEFLTARMTEDEATAKAASDHGDDLEWRFDYQSQPRPRIAGAPWESSHHSGIWECEDPDDDCREFRALGEATGEHIARHDPARVLREVESGRDLLMAYTDAISWLGDYEDPESDYNWTPEQRANGIIRYRGITDALRAAIKMRATAWSDHPDYREEWTA